VNLLWIKLKKFHDLIFQLSKLKKKNTDQHFSGFCANNKYKEFLCPPPFGVGLYGFTRVRMYVCSRYVYFRRRSEDTD